MEQILLKAMSEFIFVAVIDQKSIITLAIGAFLMFIPFLLGPYIWARHLSQINEIDFRIKIGWIMLMGLNIVTDIYAGLVYGTWLFPLIFTILPLATGLLIILILGFIVVMLLFIFIFYLPLSINIPVVLSISLGGWIFSKGGKLNC